MIAKTICVACGQHIEFSDEYAGEHAECPNCGASTLLADPTIPANSAHSANSSGSAVPANRLPDRAPAAVPPRRPAGKSPVTPIARRIIENIEKAIVDKHEAIVLLLT